MALATILTLIIIISMVFYHNSSQDETVNRESPDKQGEDALVDKKEDALVAARESEPEPEPEAKAEEVDAEAVAEAGDKQVDTEEYAPKEEGVDSDNAPQESDEGNEIASKGQIQVEKI